MASRRIYQNQAIGGAQREHAGVRADPAVDFERLAFFIDAIAGENSPVSVGREASMEKSAFGNLSAQLVEKLLAVLGPFGTSEGILKEGKFLLKHQGLREH